MLVLGQSTIALSGFNSLMISAVLWASSQFRFNSSLSNASSISCGSVTTMWLGYLLTSSNICSRCMGVKSLESFTPMPFSFSRSFSSTMTPAVTNGPITGPRPASSIPQMVVIVVDMMK